MNNLLDQIFDVVIYLLILITFTVAGVDMIQSVGTTTMWPILQAACLVVIAIGLSYYFYRMKAEASNEQR